MSDTYIQVAPDSTGAKVDNELVSTTAGDDIYRQKVALAGTAATALLGSKELLCRILVELRIQTILLTQIGSIRDNINLLRSDIMSEL